MIYKTVILGCGSIGAMKDSKYDSSSTLAVITWAHACHSHPETELSGVYDIDGEKAKKAADKWGTYAYPSLNDLLLNGHPSIVIVATPTDIHWMSLFDVLNTIPNNDYIVIAEKPVCNRTQDAKTIAKMYKQKNIPILVNYLRRYNKAIRDVGEAIKMGQFGEVYNCKITYARGFIRDGSHGIDLCRYFFGEFISGKIVNRLTAIDDYSKDDLTYAAWLSFKNCPFVFFCPVDGRAFDVFDIDIYTKKGRIFITEHGKKIMYYDRKPETTYGDYDCLSSVPRIVNTNLDTTMLSVMDNTIAVLEKREEGICTIDDAIKVHEVYDKLL